MDSEPGSSPDNGAELRPEIEFFESQRSSWIEQGHQGDWAVVRGTRLVGFFDSFGQAYRARCGAVALVRQVLPEDPVHIIHRSPGPL